MKPKRTQIRRAKPKTAGRTIKRSRPLEINRALVPIDFSKPSLQTIEFAVPLLKQFQAELHLVHIFEPSYPVASMMAIPLIVPELEVGQRLNRRLKDVAKRYGVPLRPENIHSLKGRPFEEVCCLAQQIGIDLIVLSTRGLTGLKHLVLGSTTERIVRYSPCPVLVVRPGKATKSRWKLGKILVPVDFSAGSAAGISYAVSLAKRFKSKLVLLHAITPIHFSSEDYIGYDCPGVMQQLEQIRREQMRDLIRKTNWQGLKVEVLFPIGQAGYQICIHAAKIGADLIVTSTHGSTGLSRVLLGSTAEHVVRHAACSVLVVPSHKRPIPGSRKGGR